MERTCILLKPDALQRNLLGEVIQRFERKGLKIIGLKMLAVSDVTLDEHYAQYVDKPFFSGLKRFMRSAPLVAIAIEGIDVIEAVRIIVGPTKGRLAPAGTIRGDLAMSVQANIVHASDSPENADRELRRFFTADELFPYDKCDACWVYGEEELGR